MRFSLARTVLLAVCTIFCTLSGRALAEGSARPVGLQPKDWIHIDPVATVPTAEPAYSWSQSDQQPVLLPLPAEGWAGIVMVGAIVVYFRIRRARFLSIR